MNKDIHIDVLKTNVTTLGVDAIQNAANGLLRHGAGVAGAIADAGGPDVYRESNAIIQAHGQIPLAKAVWTTGGDMPCRYVIHAVTMRFPGQRTSATVVRTATANTLLVADALACRSVGLVALGTGIGRLPLATCARGMRDAVAAARCEVVERVVFALFDDVAVDEFRKVVLEPAGRT